MCQCALHCTAFAYLRLFVVFISNADINNIDDQEIKYIDDEMRYCFSCAFFLLLVGSS